MKNNFRNKNKSTMTKSFTILLCCVLFISCMTTKYQSGISKLELGMTKQEVVSILGKNYTPLGAFTSPDGNVETWSYREENVMFGDQSSVIINFLNNRVDEWHRE